MLRTCAVTPRKLSDSVHRHCVATAIEITVVCCNTLPDMHVPSQTADRSISTIGKAMCPTLDVAELSMHSMTAAE